MPVIARGRKKRQREFTMAKPAFKWMIVANVIIGFGATGMAQDANQGKAELSKPNMPFAARWSQNIDLGEMEYLSSCAACHGVDGNGKGPLSPELKSLPADLTILAKRNDGVFPVNAIYEVIDGRKSIKAHGTREMPIWGFRYTPSPNQALSSTAADQYLNLSYDPELVARSRVLAVVDYLNRIQAK
jgi:mono/diheme cytochrome c family protein